MPPSLFFIIFPFFLFYAHSCEPLIPAILLCQAVQYHAWCRTWKGNNQQMLGVMLRIWLLHPEVIYFAIIGHPVVFCSNSNEYNI